MCREIDTVIRRGSAVVHGRSSVCRAILVFMEGKNCLHLARSLPPIICKKKEA